ncbi:MAG TPA: HAMP domain-containing sensor histidine kinase [Bryobacteraceae bacterium]|nr:HAMP domain-containing sensor histidine kinase [Bryobacteraceae bacterium]
MNRLRNKLILIFLAATVVPWGATLWITTSLLDQSLRYRFTGELDEMSRSLTKAGREYYLQACQDLKSAALAGSAASQRYAERDASAWPEPLRRFWASGDSERFDRAGNDGERLDYFVRRPGEALVYSRPLTLSMNRLEAQYRQARKLVTADQSRDLRRGFIYVWVLLASAVWLGSLVILALLAHHVSRPIQQLTAGLSELAAGNFAVRLKSRRDDEIGRAILAFNDTAAQLEQNRDRLIYLTQLASWETLARKMAHEVKNSLTPIRLTVEEMVARQSGTERKFFEQAAQIVVEEVESLERRVRAFSQFSAEPPVRLRELDLNAVVEDRVAFLKTGHPEINYSVRLEQTGPHAVADEDLVKGILVNLLENAAQAAGAGGDVLAVTQVLNGKVAVEIHDSGPGLSEQARRTLFQPTISFKKNGMGLGLSIARKSALLSGGDIVVVPGELGGAAFRVVLPNGSNGVQKSSDS